MFPKFDHVYKSILMEYFNPGSRAFYITSDGAFHSVEEKTHGDQITKDFNPRGEKFDYHAFIEKHKIIEAVFEIAANTLFVRGNKYILTPKQLSSVKDWVLEKGCELHLQ